MSEGQLNSHIQKEQDNQFLRVSPCLDRAQFPKLRMLRGPFPVRMGNGKAIKAV
jgi:hypothetical protein